MRPSKFIEISMAVQWSKKSPNLCPKASQSDQNEVQTGTWNHQNQEKVEKVKSNENNCFYYVFERLGHQKSEDFPIKNHQDSCLQSEHDFWCLKSHKLRKSDPKVIPTGHPKIIKNPWKSILGHSRALLSAPLHPMITKVVPKWCPKTPKCLQNGVQEQ